MRKALKYIYVLFIIILIFGNVYLAGSVFLKFFFNCFLIKSPDIKGMTLNEAEIFLKNTKLAISVSGISYSEYEEGKIYSQIPEADRQIKKGRTIKVWISKGKKEVIVPNFKNKNLMDARSWAEAKKIEIKNIAFTHHSYDFNYVIASNPSAGTLINEDSEISFLVSLKQNSKSVFMPDIIGLDIYSAKEILKQNNLVLGRVDYLNDPSLDENIILDSDPPAGEKLQPGYIINVIINKQGVE